MLLKAFFADRPGRRSGRLIGDNIKHFSGGDHKRLYGKMLFIAGNQISLGKLTRIQGDFVKYGVVGGL